MTTPPGRTGVAHLALTVADRTDEFVSFTDPDGIQGELWWVKPADG